VERPQKTRKQVLEEHINEFANLSVDKKEIELLVDKGILTPHTLILIEGRISDLESMIAIDKYWENR
jgi:hypothetical protein